MNRHNINPIVLKNAKREDQIIYGSTAMNLQLTPILRRKVGDYDVYSKNPRKSAKQTQKQLDQKVARGQDDFYHIRALHEGTWKVMHEGKDGKQKTKDDIGIVDYSKTPKKIKTIMINEVNYEALSSILQGKRKTLADPKSKYRHKKDRLSKDIILTSQKIKEYKR